jgi:glycosyltransferase involved in cell wall biosynthesis
LYQQADCLIAASEGEGFGLPLIEAGQKGLPILARDLTVFKEVATDFASYFNGLTGQELALAILEWMALNQQGNAPQSVNMPFLSWQQSAEQLLLLLD